MIRLSGLFDAQSAVPYDTSFYATRDRETRASAEAIVPIIQELLAPRTVIDVGCGVGTWLSVFAQSGVTEIRGVEGEWVRGAPLAIPADRLVLTDLTRPVGIPPGPFDLCMSLEVAEHLPPEAGPRFAELLTSLSRVVMFSAAIPMQGGVQHVNEQLQDYWAELFGRHGFRPVDCVRPRVWARDDVLWWYAQNTIVYVHSSVLPRYPLLQSANPALLRLVHPKKYVAAATLAHPSAHSLKSILSSLPSVVASAVRRRLLRRMGLRP
jgi:hypothetical protein